MIQSKIPKWIFADWLFIQFVSLDCLYVLILTLWDNKALQTFAQAKNSCKINVTK